MISTENMPESFARLWAFTQRFQKFLVVGAIGFATNQGFLWLLHEQFQVPVRSASPVAILISMAVTFYLNEIWTWHDRGGPNWLRRAQSYIPINLGGLLINWGVLTMLHDQWGVHYLLANIVGAGLAAIWNFGLNNAITWRK
ncbi:MAG: GtrA family protein [Thermomicrobiales bacterium]|nr:GtrA family protein [Thermomicrobiales bacterium]MCO5219098.1 GtrA family protein [Thermomicrobiales bacterium]MCO5225405.1 GtrA family protein [Thermomicrobiales bacterium]MCO5228777.1 GtrA family protein [Thermomicrobiales bacterium]